MRRFIFPSFVTLTVKVVFFFFFLCYSLVFYTNFHMTNSQLSSIPGKKFVLKMNLYAFSCPKSQTVQSRVFLFVSKLPENSEPNSLSKCCNLLNTGHSKSPFLLLCSVFSWSVSAFSSRLSHLTVPRLPPGPTSYLLALSIHVTTAVTPRVSNCSLVLQGLRLPLSEPPPSKQSELLEYRVIWLLLQGDPSSLWELQPEFSPHLPLPRPPLGDTAQDVPSA